MTEPVAWIQESSCAHCLIVPSGFNAPKPDALRSVELYLWQQFSSEIDPHVSKLNVGLRSLNLILYLTVIPLFIAVFVLSEYVDFFAGLAKFGSFIVFVPVMVFYFLYYRILKKNEEADLAIKNVCENFKTLLESKGFSIEYRTRYTGLCKPRGASPSRAIAFPYVSGYEGPPIGLTPVMNNPTNPTEDANFNKQLTSESQQNHDVEVGSMSTDDVVGS